MTNFFRSNEPMALRNAGVRVAELAGRGKSLLATRSLAPHELIFREAPLVRVSKNTRDPATAAHPVAAAALGRVHQLAASGAFDPRDFAAWPKEVVQCMERVMDVQVRGLQ